MHDWNEIWGPMTEAEIGLLSEDIEIPLPADYVQFLREVHGYIPVQCDIDFVLPDGRRFETTVGFLSGRGEEVDSVRWAARNAYEGALRSLVPVAVDGGGNYFCIAPDHGVAFVLHENILELPVSVAGSFDAFLRMLH